MFKKENATTIIFILVISLFIALGIFGSLSNSKNDTKVGETKDIPFSLENQPTLGNPDSEILLIGYGDYNCSYCQKWEKEIFPLIKKDYIDTNMISYKFINFPVVNYYSTLGAVAGEIIHSEHPEVFWDFHEDAMHASSEKTVLTSDVLAEIAFKHIPNLNKKEFAKRIDEQEMLSLITKEQKYGSDNGVKGTPSLSINGEIVSSFDYTAIQNLIAQELDKSSDKTKETNNEANQ